MREINNIEDIDANEVKVQEKELKNAYKQKLRETNQAREKAADDAKKAELKARMDRIYKKVGRTAMPRSMKKKVKREKVEVVADQATLDQKKYLGELEPLQ